MKLLKIFDKRDKMLGHQPIIYQDSVRAIIMKKDKLFMVYSEVSNEYKFPGGGIHESEIREYALRRGVLEELGKKVQSVNESLGYVDQIYNDIHDNKKYFFLRSFYYFVEVYDEDYEQESEVIEGGMKFVPAWVTFDEAIKTNQEKLDKGSKFNWTERELFVLKLLKEMRP